VTRLYARPDMAARIPLAREPVLESWNGREHPDQLRLRAYLDTVAAQVGSAAWPAQESRVVELIVGLPSTSPVDRGGRDLDNYLFPVARRLGAGRIAAAFARKVHQQGSTIAIGPAAPGIDLPSSLPLSVRTSVSTDSRAWKEAVHRACRDVVTEPLPAGPVALRIQFSVSTRRNWAALWKPAIDALGPVLGIPDPAHPFRPADDRVVDLELHRHIDDALVHDVVIKAWWHSATVV